MKIHNSLFLSANLKEMNYKSCGILILITPGIQ